MVSLKCNDIWGYLLKLSQKFQSKPNQNTKLVKKKQQHQAQCIKF